MIKTNQKNKIETILNERIGGETMYFIKLDKIKNRKFEERKNIRDKIQEMLKQPKGNKYVKLYYGLCRYAIKHRNIINYKTENFINNFYKENKKSLRDMRICEIIEGLKMLNLIELITINEDTIKLNDYKALLQLENMRKLKQQTAGR